MWRNHKRSRVFLNDNYNIELDTINLYTVGWIEYLRPHKNKNRQSFEYRKNSLRAETFVTVFMSYF